MGNEANDMSAGEALSIDAAASLLGDTLEQSGEPERKEQEPEAPEAGAEAEQSEGDPKPDDADAPDEASEGEEPESEPEQAIAPPAFWDENERAVWASLTPEAQQIVLAKEQARDRWASQKVQEAAETRKVAEQQATEFQRQAALLSDLVPKAAQIAADRWEGIDWVGLANANPSEYVALKAEYETEMATVQQLRQAQTYAEQVAEQQFLADEARKLATLAPELVDPKTGAAKRQEVGHYLLGQGIPAEALRTASATELTLAWKALQWDRAQASLSQRPKATPQKAGTPVKPSSSAVRQTSSTRQVEQRKNRFAQTGSIDDAVALLTG